MGRELEGKCWKKTWGVSFHISSWRYVLQIDRIDWTLGPHSTVFSSAWEDSNFRAKKQDNYDWPRLEWFAEMKRTWVVNWVSWVEKLSSLLGAFFDYFKPVVKHVLRARAKNNWDRTEDLMHPSTFKTKFSSGAQAFELGCCLFSLLRRSPAWEDNPTSSRSSQADHWPSALIIVWAKW